MKNLTKSFTLNLLLVFGMGGLCQADTPDNLPKSNKVEKVEETATEVNTSTDELPMKLEVEQSTTQNPELKKGKGCADIKGLEEAEGKIMIAMPDIPEAETIPCDKVDCNNLPAAELKSYTVHHIPTAKTEVACEE